MADKKASAKLKHGFSEHIRKSLVSLKRSPQKIPFLALIAAFLI